MGEEQFCYHHGTIGLDLVQVKIQILETGALFEWLCEVLSSITFDFVALQIEPQQSGTFADEVTKRFGSLVSDFVVSEVDILNVYSVLFERFTNGNKLLISDSVWEIKFVISLYHYF